MWLLLAFALYGTIMAVTGNISLFHKMNRKEPITGNQVMTIAVWEVLIALSWALYITYA